MEEKGFLEGYEIGKWEFTPRTYKFLGLSVVLNLLAIFVLGQTNLLHSKACDSHYVSKVCQVLDTIYVGSKVLAGNPDYVVKEYDRTTIDDADEIVWVSQDGAEPQFQYPEGFFYKEEQEAEALNDFSLGADKIAPPVDNSPIITPPPPRSNSGGGLLGSRPKLPKRNNKPVSGEIPDSIIGDNNSDKKNESPEKLPNLDGTTAKNDNKDPEKDPKKENPLDKQTAKNSDPVKDIEINRKPLDDFADEVLVKWQTKTVDLSQQFKVKLTGELTKNGRLDPARTRYTEQLGNPEMIEVAKRAIESVGDSGWLDYLSRFDVKKMNIVFAQNASQLVAVVDSNLPSPERAQSVASGIRGIIQATLLAHNNGWKKLKDDEVVLLKAASISNKGSALVINFNLEKPIAQKMIDSRLREYQAKKLKEKNKTEPETKPNGTAKKSKDDKNAAK